MLLYCSKSFSKPARGGARGERHRQVVGAEEEVAQVATWKQNYQECKEQLCGDAANSDCWMIMEIKYLLETCNS